MPGVWDDGDHDDIVTLVTSGSGLIDAATARSTACPSSLAESRISRPAFLLAVRSCPTAPAPLPRPEPFRSTAAPLSASVPETGPPPRCASRRRSEGLGGARSWQELAIGAALYAIRPQSRRDPTQRTALCISSPHCTTCREAPSPNNGLAAGDDGGWRPHVVRGEPVRSGAALSALRRQAPQGRDTRRPTDRTTHQIRVGHQPQDGQGAGPHHPADAV